MDTRYTGSVKGIAAAWQSELGRLGSSDSDGEESNSGLGIWRVGTYLPTYVYVMRSVIISIVCCGYVHRSVARKSGTVTKWMHGPR